jgi:hypothetical protein
LFFLKYADQLSKVFMQVENSNVNIAVIVNHEKTGMVEFLADQSEIEFFQDSTKSLSERLQDIYLMRAQREQQEEDLADYVENLVLNPMLHPEIKQQGVEWFYSRIKIDQYRQKELQAAQLIAQYAFEQFLADTQKATFDLSSSENTVHIKIFTL